MIAKLPLLAVAISSFFATACFWDTTGDDPPPRASRNTPSQTTTPAPTNVAPMLVHLDTDRTMSAAGGEGVGIFVEYKAGGHWRVSLACDTNLTGDACQMTVSAMASGLADATGTKATSLQKTAVVERNIVDFVFDADPGAAATITGTVSGVASGDGSYFFFVQDGKVNGGYQGRLTNPLVFQPSAP